MAPDRQPAAKVIRLDRRHRRDLETRLLALERFVDEVWNDPVALARRITELVGKAAGD